MKLHYNRQLPKMGIPSKSFRTSHGLTNAVIVKQMRNSPVPIYHKVFHNVDSFNDFFACILHCLVAFINITSVMKQVLLCPISGRLL